MSRKNNKDHNPHPKFPFSKVPFQETGDTDRELHDYELDSREELDLGESELRKKKHTLGEERDAGREP